MLPMLLKELGGIEFSLCGFLYQADHTQCFAQICIKIAKGAKGRIIFDKNNFLHSSCARQAPRVKELFDAECEIRLVRPPHGGFSVMHVKTLIIDDKILLTGSVNMTHNGLEHNKEHLYRITETSTVADVLADFEAQWEPAEQVTTLLIDQMMNNWQQRGEKGRENRERSASLGVCRSLSRELEGTGELGHSSS